jgi:hypothetical protein
VHILSSVNSWLVELRPIMETLFFIATIALAVFAFKALDQLRIAKEIARTSAKREAFKLAAEQCRYFAEQVVPSSNTVAAKCKQLNLASFASPKFEIVTGEIVSHDFSDDALSTDFAKCALELMAFLNTIEAFSIFFVEGIAEELVAYRETGVTFCKTMRLFMPAVYQFRKYGVRYESTVKLYEIWNARMTSEKLLAERKSIDTSLKGLRKDGIKPIGTHEY